MEASVVVPGRITNSRTKEVMQFHLNPDTLKYQPGSPKHVTDPIPGVSHPKRAYASGSDETWKFTLTLDGAIALREYIVLPQNALRPASDKSPYSIRGYIEYIKGLCRPTDRTKGATGDPDPVIFSFGKLVQKVKCDLEIGEIDITEFDPYLEPTAAKVPFVLTRLADQGELQGDVWGGWA